MNESAMKRRVWIRNVIIIFLAALLILTLCSNTILNHSLPEVAVQYPQYASIASRIRATGTIESNQSYAVTIGQTRVVSSVDVRVGQKVTKGDTLMTLEPGDSSELDAAQSELASLNIQLIQKLKQDPSLTPDASSDTIRSLENELSGARADLADAKDTLALLQGELDEILSRKNALPGYDDIMNAKGVISQSETTLEYLTGEIARLGGKQGVLGGNGYYTAEEIEQLIAQAEYALSEASNAYGSALVAYDTAAAQQKTWESRVENAKKESENAQKAVTDYESGMSGGSVTMDALIKEQEALRKQQLELQSLKTELSVYQGGSSYRASLANAQSALNGLQSQKNALDSQIAEAENKLEVYRQQAAESEWIREQITKLEADIATWRIESGKLDAPITNAQKDVAAKQNELNDYYSSKGYYSLSYSSEMEYQAAISQAQNSYNLANQEFQRNYYTYLQSSQANSTLSGLKQAAENALAEYNEMNARLADAVQTTEKAKTAYEDAKKKMEDAEAELKQAENYRSYDELSDEIKSLTKEKTRVEKEKAEAEALIESASEENIRKLETELNAKNREITAQNKTIASCEKQIDSLNRQIADERQKAESSTTTEKLDNKQYQIELQQIRDAIQKKNAEIERLEDNAVNAAVTAPVSGTIESIAVTAGQKAEANTTLVAITLTDKGYTMQCTVTSEQAARVKTGDTANIQWYYWGETPTARVVSIKPDTASQGKNKIITLEVTGDVSVGTSLTFTLGEKNASYDCVVPNSAVREDSNGKFVLIVTAKSTPLGNRYTAKRVNVEVLASDDTNSAISGAVSGEYVITTSTTPISGGMQVRLSENN